MTLKLHQLGPDGLALMDGLLALIGQVFGIAVRRPDARARAQAGAGAGAGDAAALFVIV